MKANRIFHNGHILTMDETRPEASAFGIFGDTFCAVGSDRELMSWSSPHTELVDLHGAVVTPGFIESHTHASAYAMNLLRVDCSPSSRGSIAEIKEGIRAKARQTPAGEWIQGFGYDDTLIADNRPLTRADLDEAAPEHPVQVMHISVHFSYVNTKAMEIAGLGPETPQPEGGVIHKNADGSPNGCLAEAGAMDLVRKHVKPYTAAELKKALLEALPYFHRCGVTSLHDAGIGYFFHGPQVIQAYVELEKEHRLALRVYLTLIEEIYDRLFTLGLRTGFGSSRLKIGSVKTWQDGSIQGWTGALSKPYHTRPELKGDLLLSQEALDALVQKYHAAGLQIAIHANGDRAIESVLQAFEKAFAVHPSADRRHMIIHCQTVSDEQLDRMAEIGVIPNFFVNHVYYWGDRHEALFLGPERAARLDPLKSALDRGLPFCLHSDLPVTPVAPLFSMHTAVNRLTKAGKCLGPQQRIPMVEAFKAYTTHAAAVSFEENLKGAIKTGLLADFLVLSNHPFETPPDKIKEIEVLQTFIGGQAVWDKGHER
jgi:hypothetical protein